MNILITGSTGFIGKNLLEDIEDNKKNLKNKFLFLNKNSKIKKKKNFYQIYDDISLRDESLNKIEKFKPDIILHMAWEKIPDYSEKNSLNNLKKQKIFFRKVSNIKSIKKIIITGSCSENSKKSYFTSLFFSSAKKKLKKFVKRICLKKKIEFLWIKIFFVFGKFQKKDSLINYILISKKKNKKIRLNKPNLILDFIYVKHVSNYIIKNLNLKKIGIIEKDIGSGYGTKIQDIHDFIYAKKRKIKKFYNSFRAKKLPLDFKSKISIERDLRDFASLMGYKIK